MSSSPTAVHDCDVDALANPTFRYRLPSDAVLNSKQHLTQLLVISCIDELIASGELPLVHCMVLFSKSMPWLNPDIDTNAF